ncbi:MAG TPA: carboxypeptidase-like regulatory domain-containing protein [Fimbriimonadaceae bacterium]|nr:carboxypeptidase-like regulatory domain-containing protein [Fimbriimonadaceae bacterium]
MGVPRIPAWTLKLLAASLLAAILPAGAQPAATDPLEGFVLDRYGRPASGIEVMLTWRRMSTPDTKLLATVKTDSAGHFSFPARPPRRRLEDVTIVAFGPSGEAAYGFVPGSAGALRLRLPSTSTCRVHVTDKSGRPAAGQTLDILPMGIGPPELRRRFRRTADRDGLITLTYNAKQQLFVTCPEDSTDAYNAWTVNFPAEGATRDWPINLSPACSIGGRVVSGPSDEPVPGVEVEATLQGNGGQPTWRAVTGVDGRFAIKKIWPGSYGLAIRNCEFSAHHVPDWLHGIEVKPGDSVDLHDLSIEKPAHLRCAVYNSRSHKPVVGAWVNATWAFDPIGETDENGIADLVVRAGEATVTIGGLAKRCTLTPDRLSEVEFEVEPDAPHTNELLPSAFAKVIDPEGRPVPFAIVDSSDSDECVLTDAQGNFDLRCFNPNMTIRVRKGALATRTPVGSGSDTAEGPKVFRLERGVLGSARGRVRGADGKPLADANVDILRDDPHWYWTPFETITTGPDGGFTVGDLWPGVRFRIVYRGQGSEWFTLQTGEVKGLGNLRLAALPKEGD